MASDDGTCAPGTIPVEEYVRREKRLEASGSMQLTATGEREREEREREAREEREGERDAEREREERERELEREAERGDALAILEQAGLDQPGLCVSEKHPESFDELFARAADLASPRLAGMGPMREGAFAAAADAAGGHGGGQRRRARPAPVASTATGRWTRRSSAPHRRASRPARAGPTTSSTTPPTAGCSRPSATAAPGCPRTSGESWVEVNGDLPATVIGSMAWTTAGGGRLVAVTGDGSFGGITGFPGFGAYYTDDIGDVAARRRPLDTRPRACPTTRWASRSRSTRRLPNKVYVATSKGLFRSTDGGQTFANTDLPTGSCAGVTDTLARPECQLANVVTDVVVQEPGGATGVDRPRPWSRRSAGGAAPSRTPTAPSSPRATASTSRPTAGPASPRTAMSGFTPKPKRGRIEMGAATGPDQDHDYLYAMVQDAEALNGAGCAVLDAPVDCSNGIDPGLGIPVGSINTVIDGVYVSRDFGDTWTQVASTETFQNPASGSALNGTASALGYQPGVQTWYNQFVAPDPTRTDLLTGAPSRVVIGIEEVWENDNRDRSDPAGDPGHDVARDRALLRRGHLWLPRPRGARGLPGPGVPAEHPGPGQRLRHDPPGPALGPLGPPRGRRADLFVGNDGGVYRQTVGAASSSRNANWGPGKNQGFQTLLPYSASAARDGRVWFGLQDNGSGFVDPTEDFNQFQTFGGDGFFTAVDPKNSDVAYYETPGAAMSVTTDGGESSTAIDPPADGGPYRFNNVFRMDPNDALQLATAGSKVYVTEAGPATTTPADPANPDRPTGTRSSTSAPTSRPASGPRRWARARCSTPCPRSTSNATRSTSASAASATSSTPRPVPERPGDQRRRDLPAEAGSTNGWHVAAAKGLPNRFITSIAIDPTDVQTIYVTLGGYSRKWASPGTLQDDNPNIGEGHVFKSTDGGETFSDWSGNLPDVTATWVELRGDQLLVGTDVGAFASRSDGAAIYAPLEDVPAAPIGTIQMKPHDPNTAIMATYGRGIWEYTFDDTPPVTAVGRLAGQTARRPPSRVSQQQFDRSRNGSWPRRRSTPTRWRRCRWPRTRRPDPADDTDQPAGDGRGRDPAAWAPTKALIVGGPNAVAAASSRS